MKAPNSLPICFAVLTLFLSACSEPDGLSKENETGTETYEHQLTATDIKFLRGFSLTSLPRLPAAPDNEYADSDAAAELGKQLFFDTRLSANARVACASCHQPQKYFTDGRQKGQGLGSSRRNTLTLLGASYGPWKYWDGRKDGLWAQALEPMENPEEHGFDRARLQALIEKHYASKYQAVFGLAKVHAEYEDQATLLAVNVAKALMAYQRKLRLQPSRFDRMVDSLAAGEAVAKQDRLSPAELNGLRLFMGKAACASCHNGPLFTNFEFHNIGAPEAMPQSVDLGRYEGIELVRNDEFNCLSKWSDAAASQCEEMNFLKSQGPELVGAFKTPGLRNVAETAPYMHAGQFATLEDVLSHYNAPVPPFYDRSQHPSRPHFDILPLGLNESELADLKAFLGTLTSPVPENNYWWTNASTRN